jgi:hypothetical protein
MTCKETIEYGKQSLSTKAGLGAYYLQRNIAYEEAIKVRGDSIYNIEVENQVLRKEIGNVDENYIQAKIKNTKINDDDKQKNDIILARLKKTMLKSKQI